MSFELMKHEDGSKQLIVYYTGDDYSQAIDQARRQLGKVCDNLPCLAIPVSLRKKLGPAGVPGGVRVGGGVDV